MSIRGVFCFVFALVTAWKFAILFLAFLPIVVFQLVLKAFVDEHSSTELNSYGPASNIAQEGLQSIRTILSLGLVRKWINKYSKSLDKIEKISKRKGFLIGLTDGLKNATFNLCFAVAIYYSFYLFNFECKKYNLEIVIQSLFFIITAALSFANAIPFFNNFLEIRPSAKKVFDILKIKPSEDSMGVKLEHVNGDIEFENVHFSYKAEKKFFNGINLKINTNGKTVVIIGPEGAGKSTIISLLQRFYKPQSGQIKIDGHNIQALDLEWYKEQIGFVSQEPLLFTGSIKENIKLGRLNATDLEIEKAAKHANAHDFIMNTVDEYDTLIGDGGLQLSQTQKQRIAIGMFSNNK